ncbi:LysR family transcriptional regulator [Photobacterium lutimaris]|uniref:LysR family transcriptional regulator n=1 Tax=Photobacterium lutimaris TaxID=388278 RepID=A0A2T3IZI3_9GAMM|nr:LysR family transcriptional regulator [Photobacterium lutimaris]PSU34047.1 LysR family transcriptional regulator [Photobacterium lutimaris]TDR76390.1 DNA-binding transcriptional LysR family regulator [Photobacterium lutimaris]
MNWTIDQLEAFVCAVQQGSFSAAARKLGKAQSRVSTAINNLELDLGFELFDRSARLPVLTPEGEEMYIEAQAVLAQCERMSARAMTVSSGEEATFTVAIDEAVPITAFESLFASLTRVYPLLKLTIINGSQQDISQWVATEKADLGVLFHQDVLPDSLEFTSIGQFKHALIVSREHPLAAIPVPKISDLTQHRQLVIRDRMGVGKAKPISSNYWHIDSYYLISSMVIRGVGWALVPEHVAQEEWYVDALVELSTEEIPEPLMVEIGAVKRRDKGVGQVMNWMYTELTKMF